MPEKMALVDVEEEIQGCLERGLKEFLRVGQLLQHILANRLYADTYASFDAYIKHKQEDGKRRWPFNLRRAYQLIGAAESHKALCTIGTQLLPENERQYRMIGQLPPDEQAALWEQALAEAGGELPASKKIAELVAARLEKMNDQEQLQTVQDYESNLTDPVTQKPINGLRRLSGVDKFFLHIDEWLPGVAGAVQDYERRKQDAIAFLTDVERAARASR